MKPMPDHPSDHDLLTRFADGETEAFGQLAERYEQRLLSLARGLLGGSFVLAEEAVQEAWVKVIRAVGSGAGAFEGRSQVWTWLYRITVNCCRDINRRQRLRAKKDRERTPVQAVEETGNAFEAEVRAAVDRLPVEKREAIMLSVHAELTDEQAAAVLAIPLGTYKSRVRAAKTTLRRALQAEVQA
jgi:RNA polymerase sigma-70 factor, ECF subfamily